MSLVEIKNLSVGYQKVLQKNLNITIEHGDILLINGANGTGKSTFIKTLLNQMSPLKGDITFSNPSITIEQLPQTLSYDLPLSLTIKEILESFHFKSSEKELSPIFLNKKWNETSGGEKQKTLILTRLARECDILILDEPFNHMDKPSIAYLTQFLLDLHSQDHVKAIIIVSHILTDLPKNQSVKTLNFQ